MAEAPEKPQAAPKVIGGFELISKIGAGGMGSVFKARQLSLDRVVALKILPRSIAKDQKYIERFQREARACAKMNHVNIVQGIDVGLDEASGLWYFAMEYVDGPSLKDTLKQQRMLPELRVLEIARDVARALECAAAQGIVHRDIKPDNILQNTNGQTKLADLGLAREVNASETDNQATSGEAAGTPYYMAPEQVRGLIAEIDFRTDVYGLGATMFHLATGMPPYSGETSRDVMSKHLTEPVPNARRINMDVSEPCSRLIERMMQKKREQRVQTPAELIASIENTIAEIKEGPKIVVRPMKKRTAASTAGMAVGIAAALALLVVAGIVVLKQSQKSDVAQNPKPTPAAISKPVETPRAKVEPPNEPVAVTKKEEKPAPSVPPPETKTPETKIAESPPAVVEKPAPPPVKEPEIAEAPKPEPKVEVTTPPVPPVAEPEAPKRSNSGFRGEYFERENLNALQTTKTDEVIDFKWPDGAPSGLSSRQGFSARWTGFVEPPDDGDYVFEITADEGSRLSLANWLLLDQWSGGRYKGRTTAVTLEKGKKYLLTFEMHNRSDGAEAQLKWGRANETPQLVRADHPETEAKNLTLGHLAGGWRAEYGKFDTVKATVTRNEPVIDWKWGNGSPATDIPGERFWANWTGIVSPPETDEYVFHLDVDEGAKLYLNEMLVIDAFNSGPGDLHSAPIKLQKDKRYAVLLEYIERSETAHCSLKWSSTNLTEQPVRAHGEGKGDDALPQSGFLAEYGHEGSPTVIISRRELSVNSNWRNGSPAPEIKGENFWANYYGWITPPADGEYSFSIEFDELCSLYIDDVMLFESGPRSRDDKVQLEPITLKGGKHYAMKLEFHERSDTAQIRLHWSSANLPKQLVPASIPEAFSPQDKDVGHIESALLAEYGPYTSKTPQLRRLEGRLVHDWGSNPPTNEIRAPFWGRWTGALRIPATGEYAFKLDASFSAEMKINGASVLKVPTTTTGKGPGRGNNNNAETRPIPLTKGATYPLEVSHMGKRDEYSNIKLQWKPPGAGAFEDIPADAFIMPPQGRDLKKTK